MVFCDAEMPSILRSSTTAAATPPLPLSPWQAEHFSAKIDAPCAGVPLPFGNPVPSGRMLMSQLAIAASSIGLPRCGVSAKDAPARITSASAAITTIRLSLSVNMLDLAAAADTPACDRVVVLIGKTQHRRRLGQFAANRDKFSTGRLHIARLVPCAALQRRRSSIPAPRQTETRKGFAQDRLLKRGRRPALS